MLDREITLLKIVPSTRPRARLGALDRYRLSLTQFSILRLWWQNGPRIV